MDGIYLTDLNRTIFRLGDSGWYSEFFSSAEIFLVGHEEGWIWDEYDSKLLLPSAFYTLGGD